MTADFIYIPLVFYCSFCSQIPRKPSEYTTKFS